MSEPAKGLDYVARRSSYGGSHPGRDVRKAPFVIKLAAWKWAVKNITAGDESGFYRQTGPVKVSRFSARLYEEVLIPLSIFFPEEYGKYIGERETAANIIAQRIHKMYYGQTKTTKGRGESSREHPKNWSAEDRAYAESRLAEAGWPW